jgi:hypothetical protein
MFLPLLTISPKSFKKSQLFLKSLSFISMVEDLLVCLLSFIKRILGIGLILWMFLLSQSIMERRLSIPFQMAYMIALKLICGRYIASNKFFKSIRKKSFSLEIQQVEIWSQL